MTSDAHIVCSCRSGDAPHLDGYATAELLPLSDNQISSIVEGRTQSTDAFLLSVAKAGISNDLLDRPLFLNQLLTVFETNGSVPERPVELYRQLLQLLIHDWDRQHHVQRRSDYAGFDGETKREFLSEFAFRLTIEGRATFAEEVLLGIYAEIHKQFRLPGNQARRVVREIESHVGIVMEVPSGFQVSHFTMQEYLCADNISRRPLDKEVAAYLPRFPAVIAIALSPRPTTWLVECLRLSRSFKPPRLASAFVSRLGLERPRFSPDIELGEALLSLMAQAAAEEASSWERLGSIDAVRESVDLLSE